MSTDLEFPYSLPVIRLRPAAEEIQKRGPSTEEDLQDNKKEAIQNSVNHSKHGLGDGNEDNDCRTPTSVEHQIPVMRSCPPTPKKKKGVILCKRRLSNELQFFEITARHEVESFFRSSFHVKKHRSSNSNSKANSG